MVRVAMDKKRGTEVVSDMLRSLAVVIVVIIPLWLLIPHHTRQHVTVIDYSTELSQARRVSAHPLVAPAGLPSAWRPTSVSSSGGSGTPLVFHLGYVTPAGDYAALEESDGPVAGYLVTLEGKTPQSLDSVRVGTASWQQLRGTDGRLALVSTATPTTVVVKGTAKLAELETLAASLR
ncbi:hypothetical protein acdb102_05280 [Acidothermaceae bacterium B102]|nr:hypothetical protein acdb102_05280 [Acidothermaceae bacterium B102]